ncbi:hypothetical protein GGP41_003842, partial [Bipolaris sorokiniana]
GTGEDVCFGRLSIITTNFQRHVASHGIVVYLKGPPYNIDMHDTTTFNKPNYETSLKNFDYIRNSTAPQIYHKIVRLCTWKDLCHIAGVSLD